VSATGDPHLTNVNGQSFDINRAGVNTFLLFPRSTSKTQQESTLRVEASVEHPGDGTKCKGWYIVRLWVSGSIIGDEIELSTNGYEAKDGLEMKVGTKVLQNQTEIAGFIAEKKYNMTFTDSRESLKQHHVNNRINFAQLQIDLQGVELKIIWSTGKKLPNAMNFVANHLKMLGNDWGGLLGGDDHTFVSQYDPACKKSETYGEIPQLLSDEGEDQWTAKAALD